MIVYIKTKVICLLNLRIHLFRKFFVLQFKFIKPSKTIYLILKHLPQMKNFLSSFELINLFFFNLMIYDLFLQLHKLMKCIHLMIYDKYF